MTSDQGPQRNTALDGGPTGTGGANAKRNYSDRCGELFQLSDIAKAEGHPLSARLYHDAAVIIGHAAWAEEVDPDE